MRTEKEILQRIAEVTERDWLGTQRSDLVGYLSFDAARPFLKEHVTEDEWTVMPKDKESILKEMHKYMDFAWDKANNHRGISAGRSLEHMSVWLWMLERRPAAEQILSYSYYGKPQLRAICEEFGWDWRDWDDGDWTSYEDADGDPPPESVDALEKGEY